ncbi:MAG TPA: hypothetical protein VN380_16740 [Thermoanaerobaculia bacterium]|nr:hypothetical protein [Thermoanaerobaculia bacterium]
MAFVAVALLFATQALRGQASKASTGVVWKPPVIPISISLGPSGFDVSFSAGFDTPYGSFSVSGPIDATKLEPVNTYFIVRKGNVEKIYCIGTHGKLRLKASGKHTVELSSYKDHVNAVVVDIKSQSGTINLEFTADESTLELARIRGGMVDMVLRKTGEMVADAPFRDTVISPNQVERITFGTVDATDLIAICVEYRDQKTRKRISLVGEGQSRLEALWFRECVLAHMRRKVVTTQFERSFSRRLYLFKDGSILIRAVSYSPHWAESYYVFATPWSLRSIDFETHWFRANSVQLTYSSGDTETHDLGNEDETELSGFVTAVRKKIHSGNTSGAMRSGQRSESRASGEAGSYLGNQSRGRTSRG